MTTDNMVERLWDLHRRALSYASDTPAVNLLLADLGEGLKAAIDAMAAINSTDGVVDTARSASRRALPRPCDPMETCDACNGAGDDGHGHICGKCDGAGGYPNAPWQADGLAGLASRIAERTALNLSSDPVGKS